MKAHKVADSDKGAAELDALMEAIHGPDWVPAGNGLDMTDAEFREWETKQMDALWAQLDAEAKTYRESHIILQRVRRVLREMLASQAELGLTMSGLQPVLDLAHELNPSFRSAPQAPPF